MNKKKTAAILIAVLLLTQILLSLTACGSLGGGYDVIFTVDGEEYKRATVNVTNGKNMPENPTKEGFEFKGWYVDEELTVELNADYFTKNVVTGTLTVYAKWAEKTEIAYTVDEKDASYIYFGSYPQTVASNNAILKMNAEPGEDGYYVSEYDNAKYAKIVSTPHSKGYKFSTGETIISGKIYYYKVEPVKWKIINDENELLLIQAATVLDNHTYQSKIKFDEEKVVYYNDNANAPSGVYANDWENSEIRKWLNEGLYNVLFNADEKKIIKNTSLNNTDAALEKNIYTSAQRATSDKVFLLSYKDMINSYYGFSALPTKFDNSRIRSTTDYVRSKGVWMNTDNICYGNAIYWLRTGGKNSTAVSGCNDYASLVEGNVSIAYYGVVPALYIEKAEEANEEQ